MPKLDTAKMLAYDLKTASDASGLSISTLRRAIYTSDPFSFPPPLPAKQAGSKLLLLANDLAAWLESLPDA